MTLKLTSHLTIEMNRVDNVLHLHWLLPQCLHEYRGLRQSINLFLPHHILPTDCKPAPADELLSLCYCPSVLPCCPLILIMLSPSSFLMSPSILQLSQSSICPRGCLAALSGTKPKAARQLLVSPSSRNCGIPELWALLPSSKSAVTGQVLFTLHLHDPVSVVTYPSGHTQERFST